MGFGFLAPLLLGGAALIAVPWLVHRIRRPQRRAVRFSSLLFVPAAESRVIERHRVQHPLLMLLRMLMLLLAAVAFARPYKERLLAPLEPSPRSTYHVIALDISYSMAAGERMAEARRRATAIVDSLPDADRVAVVTFARSAAVDASLPYPGDAESGSPGRARQAIDHAAPTWESTDYAAALQAAERLLQDGSPAAVARVVHLVSDFQEVGMPPSASGWRLSSRIALAPVAVDVDIPANLAVEELVARPVAAGQVQIRARVRSWAQDGERSASVKLVADGEEVETTVRTLSPGSASRIDFSLPWDDRQPLSGYVEIDADGLLADNRRYFAFNPHRRHRVLLVRQPGALSYDRLLEAAVPAAADLPWRLLSVSPPELENRLDDPPRIVVAANLEELDRPLQEKLRAYVDGGGRLFLPLGPGATSTSINRLLGADAGVELKGLRAAAPAPASPARLAWVDLGHPLFHPFRSARFNDFSLLHFYSYHLLGSKPPAAVLARFREESGASSPAIVEIPCGVGRILLWAGGIDPAWSNLSRSPRFVPLLHETLRYLAADRPPRPGYTVGDPAVLPMQDQDSPAPWVIELVSRARGAVSMDLEPGSSQRLLEPGLLRWRSASDPQRQRVEAINVDTGESDPARISPAEFAIRLCDAPLVSGTAADEGIQAGTGHREYGRAGIGLLFGFLLLESWYAARLSRRSSKENP
jgi:hypothetical protein